MIPSVYVPRGLQVEIAVAKVGKYATGESGDSVEVVERPHGGVSVVLVDGQRSGRSAKLISSIAVRKIVSLLADGVRDGAVARAAHDYLRTIRQGKVSAEVSIMSLDLVSGTVVISRNTHCPALILRAGEGGREILTLDDPSEPIGIHAWTKPVIHEVGMEAGLYVILFSDGVLTAGSRRGRTLDLPELLRRPSWEREPSAASLADGILAEALSRDDGRPDDDMSVVVLAMTRAATAELTRRMLVRLPV